MQGRTTRLGKAGVWGIVLLMLLTGCRSSRRRDETDAEIRRHADAARTAFVEGIDDRAIDRYRKAVRRAWLIDDHQQIGVQSYNLAMALASVGRLGEARDWLGESRAALSRIGKDVTKVQLLEAKIARQQGLPYEAEAMTDMVARAVYLASRHHDHHGPQHAGHKMCVTLPHDPHHVPPTPLVACRHLADRVAKRRECHPRYQKRTITRAAGVEVALIRAELACDEMDLARAAAELAEAEQQVRRVRDLALHAEVERVGGRLLLLQGLPLAAAARFDTEAELLRQAESYRQIPMAYETAGEAYALSGLLDVAADRFIRAAAMLYARGDQVAALWMIDRALPLAEASGSVDIQGRIAIVFAEIFRAIEDQRPREETDRPRAEDAEPVEPWPSELEDSPPAPPAEADLFEGMLPEPLEPAGPRLPDLTSDRESRRGFEWLKSTLPRTVHRYVPDGWRR